MRKLGYLFSCMVFCAAAGCIHRVNYILPAKGNGKLVSTRTMATQLGTDHVHLDEYCGGRFHRISTQESPFNFLIRQVTDSIRLTDIGFECAGK
jgi:hypothetical protein